MAEKKVVGYAVQWFGDGFDEEFHVDSLKEAHELAKEKTSSQWGGEAVVYKILSSRPMEWDGYDDYELEEVR